MAETSIAKPMPFSASIILVTLVLGSSYSSISKLASVLVSSSNQDASCRKSLNCPSRLFDS